MPCEELQVGLTQANNPAGSLTQAENPSTSGFCRSFDFTRPNLVTFALQDIQTFAGDQIDVF